VDIDERLTRLEGVVEKLADHMVTFAEANIALTKRWQETDERFRQTDERIDKLVSAIGEFIRRQSDGGGNIPRT